MDDFEISEYEIVTPELQNKIIDLIDVHIKNQKEGFENEYRPTRRQVTCNKIDFAKELARKTGQNIIWIETHYVSKVALYFVLINRRAFVVNIGIEDNNFNYVDEYWCNDHHSCLEY